MGGHLLGEVKQLKRFDSKFTVVGVGPFEYAICSVHDIVQFLVRFCEGFACDNDCCVINEE